MKIGARTFKTGLAIFLSIIIPITVGYSELASLSAISVISSMQPSVKRSYVQVRDRVFANTIGGVVAYLIVRFFGNTPIMIGVASAILIAILNHLKLNSVINLSIMTLITIMLLPVEDILYSATTRVLATILGVLIAFTVNTLLFPPNYDARLYQLTNEVTNELTSYIRISLRKNMQFGIMHKDLKNIKSKIRQMKSYLDYIQDGRVNQFIFKRDRRSLIRLTVVYRQFIRTTEAAYHLSSVLHHSENIYNNFPDDLRILIRERVEVLMAAHEQILMKWNGRILPEDVNFMTYKSDLRVRLMKSFFDEASLDSYLEGEYGESNTVIRLMTALLEYEESLRKLNTLVSNYMKLHKDETNIKIDEEFE